jgi:NTE family protein
MPIEKRIILVLSGGLGLGAYQAGAYQRMEEDKLRPSHIAGSSVGAVNGALILGSAANERIDALRAFWAAGPLVSLLCVTWLLRSRAELAKRRSHPLVWCVRSLPTANAQLGSVSQSLRPHADEGAIVAPGRL